MKDILKHLSIHPLIQDFSIGKVSFSHLSLTQEALLIASSYQVNPRPMVIIKPNLYQAQQLHEKIQFWLEDQTVLYPVEESFRVEAIAASPEINVIRMETLSRLTHESNLICVTHLGAALRYTPLPSFFKEQDIHLTVSQSIPLKVLSQKLRMLGYTETLKVDQPNCFATRGGIVDIYPNNASTPIRIEFFDQEIESIRSFDVSSQRTTEQLDMIHIQPASDLIYTEEELKEIEIATTKALEKERLHKSQDFILELEENLHADLELIRHHIKENHLARYRVYLSRPGHLLRYFDRPTVYLSTTED